MISSLMSVCGFVWNKRGNRGRRLSALGIAGFLVSSEDEIVETIWNLPTISRVNCRARVEERLSADCIVSEYETLYLRHSCASRRRAAT
jgi:hypothetical protein